MIGNSINKTTLANVRIAGLNAKNGELKCGGTYTPAYVRADGKFVRARWFGQMCVNESYLDGQSKLVEKQSWLPLTVWNGPNADSGEKAGMADVFARMASTGRQISYCEVRIRPYTGDVYDKVSGAVAVRADGTKLQSDNLLSMELINPETLIFGDESSAQIAREEAAWTADLVGKPCFHARPAGLSDVDRTAFMSLRKSVRFVPGAKYYGHAKAGNIPTGAKLAHGVIAGSSGQALPGAVASSTPVLPAGIDMTNPAVIAALAALGVQTPPAVAQASPAVLSAGEESLV